jgi:hypothetical protein
VGETMAHFEATPMKIEDESLPLPALLAAEILISQESCHHLPVVMEFLIYLVQISCSALA